MGVVIIFKSARLTVPSLKVLLLGLRDSIVAKAETEHNNTAILSRIPTGKFALETLFGSEAARTR
jgi:hypothetical protein